MPTFHKPTVLSITAIMILVLLLSGFIPAIFVNTQDTESRTVEMNESETIPIQSPLSATLHSANQDSINISVIDTEIGESIELSNIEDSQSTTLRSETISVTRVQHTENVSAVVSFEYPTFYQWDNSIVRFIGVMALIILVIFLYILWILVTDSGE